MKREQTDDLECKCSVTTPGLMGLSLVRVCGFAKKDLPMSLGQKTVDLKDKIHIDAPQFKRCQLIESRPAYPFISLIVSGGHTRLVLVKGFMDHELLGDTRDDAAGEAFDKTAKILGLPYPGGPVMDARAREGDPDFVKFPRALLSEGYEFSFSGLKTSVLYHVEGVPEAGRATYLQEHTNDLCASVSQAITDVLTRKTRRALKAYGVGDLVLAGGVSANSMLRAKMQALGVEMGVTVHIPKPVYCTDNAAMIAVTGYFHALDGHFDDIATLEPFAST